MNGLPLKSVAVALLFCVFLGPIGLLYATLTGGILMLVLGFFALRAKLMALAILIWLLCCIWGVAATNRYNKKRVQP
ncbi:MAG TPA: hypothetical protein VLJ15_06435 [Gammaproteobacteria bacterium]|nr:hypothetical protein [Gammaproteobacteria bacterium]